MDYETILMGECDDLLSDQEEIEDYGSKGSTSVNSTTESSTEAQPNTFTCPASNTVNEVIPLNGDESGNRNPGNTVHPKQSESTEEEKAEQERKFKINVKAVITIIIVATPILFCWAIAVVRFSLLVTLSALPGANTSNSTTIGTKVDHLINLLSYFVQCFEHWILLYGICCFICHVFRNKDYSTCDSIKTCCDCCSKVGEPLQNPICEINEDHNFCSNYKCECSKDCCCKIIVAIILILPITLFHLAVSFAPPVLLIKWQSVTVELYSRNPTAGKAYAGLAIVDHLYNFVMRTAMVIITLYVMYAWKKAEKDINKGTTNAKEDGKDEAKDTKQDITKDEMNKLVDKYHSTGERVNAVQGILQGWFVVKWLVYFINITGDSILAAGILLSDNRRGDEYEYHQLIFILTYLAHDFIAFFFLFFCGSVMNHYHANYRKNQAKLLRKKLSESDDKCFYLMQGSDNLISEVPEYQFLPTVFWIDFPLNSPGYILSMLLALVAFIANFLTQYKD